MSLAPDQARVHPGLVFRDTRGVVAQLHGAGLLHADAKWYAWGEDKTAGGSFRAIASYSSFDLATWTFEGNALDEGLGDLAGDRVVERPKVLQRPDGKWVMFVHVDTADYAYARVGYAVSDAPTGPYVYVGSERPLGNTSRDIGVYQEGERAYLLSEDRDNGLHIYELNDDYLGVASVVATLRQQARPEIGYESPALVKHDGIYYLFGSDLTGWNLNDNQYATAPHLTGPWSPWRPFAPQGTATFGSQVSAVVPTPRGHLYVGDRWLPEDLANSGAVWLPIDLSKGQARLTWRDEWDPTEIL